LQSLQTLDIFIARTQEYAERYTWVPRIINSADLESPESIKAPSKAPLFPFTSPFIDTELPEVNKIFTERFAPLDAFTGRLFVVIDKRTAEEDVEWATCLVVFGGANFDKDDEKSFLRTDFYLSMVLLTAAELGSLDLDEGVGRNDVMGVHNMTNF
jgi:hypothetical protein